MISKKPLILLAAAACSVAFTAAPQASAETTVSAQAKAPIKVVAEGLNGPRGLTASHGRFYVAESDAGQISVIDPKTGAKKAVVTGLATPQGVTRIGSKIYAVTGEADPDGAPSAAPASAVMVAKPGQSATKFADLLAYELKKNPDKQTQFGPDGKPLDALSNPFAVIADRHGFLLVADAGGNDVLKVSKKGKVSTFFVPPTITTGACATVDNNNATGKGCDSVPTGLAYGPDNTLYISALTSEVAGEGRVYVVNARTGKLKRTITGLTAPTGVAVGKKGTVYVSELLEGAPEGDGPPPAGFDPSTVGQIVKITPGRARTYGQVTMPSGLLFRDGKLYASAWSIASFLGINDAGQVVRVADSVFVKK